MARSSALPIPLSVPAPLLCLSSAAMWAELLSHPATRSYLMRFPPSMWEEKAVEAVQSAVEGQALKQRSSGSKTTKPVSVSSGGGGSGSGGTSWRSGHSKRARAQKSSHSSAGGRTSQSVTSSPSLPAQPISVVSGAQLPSGRYPLVRPLTPHHPLLTGHERPLTYADEYYYGNPYLTSSSAIGSYLQTSDWPHRIGRNERNYSSATLLHHHTHTATAQRVDEALQTTPVTSAAQSSALEDAAVDEVSGESVQQVESRAGEERAGGWLYERRQGSDIIINVQYQHPQQPAHSHSSPALLQPTTRPKHSSHQHSPQPMTPIAHTATEPPLAHASQGERPVSGVRVQHSTLPSAADSIAPASRGLASVSPPLPSPSTSTPLYSSSRPVRPALHPTYFHPHPVYPAWWPSEEDRLAEERREEEKRVEEERRQRRRAMKQREANARVRAVMDHTCPPPPSQAREGVAERKQDRRREMKRQETERAQDRLMLQAGGEDVNILARVDRTTRPLLAAHLLPSRPSSRPLQIAQSRIKPLLDRDRRQGALFDRWESGPLMRPQPLVRPVEAVGEPLVAASSTMSSTGGHSGHYASLIRSLAADPIVSSFASHTDQHQLQQPTTLTSHTADMPSLPLAATASHNSMLAAAASMSAVAAVAALDAVDTGEDGAGARREWGNIATAEAVQPLSGRVQQWKRTGWREVQVEDGSDDSNEGRLSGVHSHHTN